MAEPAALAPSTAMPVPAVGIGASAGGLEAIGELLAALPAATGMAYLVVQHLDPERASLLAEILAKKTSMPVAEVRDGTSIAPDHVYIIPPNTLLSVSADAMHLEPRAEGRQPSMPVDVLFHSLARERGRNAIGVVLSGSGSDGARGLQAIKEAGGITFAQHEASAGFSGMPKSAIGTGCVDFVLTPPEMAATLARLGRHPYINMAGTDDDREPPADAAPVAPAAPSNEADFRRAFRLLRASSEVDFTHYKRSTIERRVARRMAVHHLDSLPAYVDLLQDNPAELQTLAQDLLIGVTSFFRDPEGLDGLTQTVFPALMAGRSPKDALRIWVPGCATGEEVYSIAMTLVEFLGQRAAATPVQIFGTDVSDTAVERARAGIYLASIAAEVSPERLAHFFVKLDDHYQIARSIRGMCVFARQDATRDPPFSRLDLVSCCNLLIYLDQPLQRQMLSLFHYALKPHGFLMLGPSESVGQNAGLFELVGKRQHIYSRKAVPGRGALPFVPDQALSPTRHDAGRIAGAPALLDAERMQREADRLLLTRYAPACVLVDEDLNVLQFRGQTAPYLEHPPGAASLNLRKLALPGLLIALGPAMQEARKTGAPVRTGTVRLETRDGMREVTLHVNPFQVPDEELRGYLVAFEEARLGRDQPGRVSFWDALVERTGRTRARAADDKGAEGERARLERELVATREYLRAAVEEHDAAKEELRSAHEEVLSSNEELQSTNEELETAKEELQSANEELVTTNEELRNRNRDLAAANEALAESRDYAEGIIETSPAPLIVLDGSLHVVTANRAFYDGFKTRREETEGRFFYDLGNKQWDIPQLRTVLQEVLAQDNRLEDYEVRHSFPAIGETVMVLNARRLPGSKRRPEMILLGLQNVTERWRAQALEEAGLRKDEFLAMLAHELRNPLAPIRLAIDILRRVGTDNPAAKFGHDVIDRQIAHLTRLVDDLLDVARITQGRIALEKAPLALAEVIERAIEVSRPLLQEREHRLTVLPAPASIYLEADGVRLVQVVSNLLNNASRFTPKGGEIALSTQADDTQAVIRVTDNGSGISAELLPNVFDMFFQADKSHSRQHGGMGIGLTLARRIVELHGGNIEAKSAGVDKGSEFIVRLPAIHPAAGQSAEVASVKAAAAVAASRRVLIVDDNVDAATMMQSFLQMQGHEARCAFDGPSGLRLAQEFAPHLVLLDIAMPGMDGYGVIRRLREQAGAQPVVAAVTGFGADTERERIKRAGFDRHLVKPVDPEAVLTLIASLEEARRRA